jgi:hypothetical protein
MLHNLKKVCILANICYTFDPKNDISYTQYPPNSPLKTHFYANHPLTYPFSKDTIVEDNG